MAESAVETVAPPHVGHVGAAELRDVAAMHQGIAEALLEIAGELEAMEARREALGIPDESSGSAMGSSSPSARSRLRERLTADLYRLAPQRGDAAQAIDVVRDRREMGALRAVVGADARFEWVNGAGLRPAVIRRVR